MIFRTIGLGAACLALVAESIMIPSTVSLPELTDDSINRQDDADDNSGADEFKALPLPGDLRKPETSLWWSGEHMLPTTDPKTIWIDSDDADNMDASDWAALDPEIVGAEFVYDPESLHVDKHDGKDVQWIEIDIDGLDFGDLDFDFHDLDKAMFDNDEDEDEDEDDEDEDGCPSGSSLKALICRLRHTVEDKIEEVKPYFTKPHRRPCPKKLAAMAKQKAAELNKLQPPHVSGGIAKFWPYFHPSEEMPKKHEHSSHHHHKHHNKFVKILHKICKGLRVFVTGFLIPVLIGVAAGMTASLLGMCVGTFLAWCWIKFVRGGKRGNASGRVMLDEADNIEAATAEKDGLLKSDTETETEEAPPTYVERE